MKLLSEINEQLDYTLDNQIFLTFTDARSMRTCGSGIADYNVETAVYTKHHFVVNHDVSNHRNECDQLFTIANKAPDAMGNEQRTVISISIKKG